MIRRLYLPFQSARAYKDRGMAKWMGFFISDHLSALQEDALTVEFGDEVSVDEILEWLSQIYIQQLTITYYVKNKKACHIVTGKILELTKDHMILHITNTADSNDNATDASENTTSVVSGCTANTDDAYERIDLHSIIRLSKTTGAD
ncbi:MAG: hypothetical protein KHZ77_06695 [Veillonella sp.]|uniref:hypothetical protein n=1 Tax=Veillonella sp. TaxID=1926307 RepID=UPI0025E70AEC|nr:hypothetical protein [Veillonella sp.]MBS4913839.1 hypothetical protein [Veillonella sp.]